MEFIKNEEHKYVRMLGAFYLRMVGKPLEVYQYLEARRVAHSALAAKPSAHARAQRAAAVQRLPPRAPPRDGRPLPAAARGPVH